MSGNRDLNAARAADNDEFYTQYSDIESEMNAYIEFDPDVFRDKTVLLPCDDPERSNFTKYFSDNFKRFGLKKLISTSYAKESNDCEKSTLNKSPFPSSCSTRTRRHAHGKLYVRTKCDDESCSTDSGYIEFSGLLEGDGDFRPAEVDKFLQDADIVITNPSFSLFREFVTWVTSADKKFSIIGNVNAITYKDVFPMLKDNDMWLGCSIHSGDRKFNVPDYYQIKTSRCGIDPDGRKYIYVNGVRWFTNIDHGQHHDFLKLDTMEHNLRFNKRLRKKLEKDYGTIEYPHFDNYDVIEVPFTECIPSDYNEVMAVPITFFG